VCPTEEVWPPEPAVVALSRGRTHHGSVGAKGRHGFGFVLVLILLGGAAGCVYEYPEPVPSPAAVPDPVRTATAGPEPVPETTKPSSDPRVLEHEARNYAELDRLLRAALRCGATGRSTERLRQYREGAGGRTIHGHRCLRWCFRREGRRRAGASRCPLPADGARAGLHQGHFTGHCA
jgi:hypothetical protein